MINSLQVQNFKSLRDVQVDLERFTVLVGPNASGKSSLLQVLDLLCRAFHCNEGEFESEINAARSRNAAGPVEVVIDTEGMSCRYRSRASDVKRSGLVGSGKWSGDGCAIAVDGQSDEWSEWKHGRDNEVPLPRSVLLRLEVSKLIDLGLSPKDPIGMAPDGSRLHSALAGMALNDPDSWQSLQSDLRRIIPTIERLRHTRPSGPFDPVALLFDTSGAKDLTADQISEGTLLVLGLLGTLYAADRPNLVLLDDLDRGLHPKAQRELISLLRSLLETNPELQIVGSTHSPYMLDCMEPSEVRMTFLKEDGSTRCAPLASHPEFDRWKDEMTPGEMWSLFGEKWLVTPETTG